MCGIVGFTNYKGYVKNSEDILSQMLQRINARGPDDRGTWQNDEIALGHNRLSILDLTAAGHQPMISQSGRYIISYNGEIYNAEELRREFPSDYRWRGHSDTEVILSVIERDGIKSALDKLVGMFAFGVFNTVTNELHLVRDHIGIKPLYYGFFKGEVLFASQIKSFLSHPCFEKEICPEAMSLFLKNNFIPAPYAIYNNCFKLEPGHMMTFRHGKIIEDYVYWSMEEAALNGFKSSFSDTQEALESFEALLCDSITKQLVADVPVGMLLSGGIDSSLVASIAQKHTAQRIKTFTIGFHEQQYNEADHALKVANHLATDHIEEYLPIDKAAEIIPDIPNYCDEPFADASQIPTLLVSRLAKKDVKVVLSGDGGDEFFAGYTRYQDILKLQKYASALPVFVKRGIAKAMGKLPSQTGALIGSSNLFKLHMISQALMKQSPKDVYDGLFNFWDGLLTPHKKDWPVTNLTSDFSDLAYMQFHDSVRYLPDDILTKLDRCSMHVSLESRVPLLDHRLVEMAWRIPENMKIHDHQTKWLLRQILYKYVPKNLIERPKKGFAIPIDIWLKGPLKEWAMDLLDDIRKDGLIPYAPIKKCMDDHQKGYVNWQYPLWGILMWQLWKKHYFNSQKLL